MAIKLDDFLTKKKEPVQVLDLSRVKITSKDELRKYLEKIPEFKIKPEKVPPEAVRIREKDFSFLPSRKELRREHRSTKVWNYPDPIPPDMRGVRLEDLCPVAIEWKMLTTLRPKAKIEEEMFTRLVHLGKLDLKYQQALKKEKDTDWVRRTKNPKSSIIETRVLSCRECGEDFCDGSLCGLLTYESFFRIQQTTAAGFVKDDTALDTADEEKSKKKRRRGKKKGLQRKLRKNSIFNRPASQGCSRDHAKRQRNAENRSRSQERGRSRVLESENLERAPRSKSAPRISFKMEDEFFDDSKIHKWVSDVRNDFAKYSQSDSEPENPKRRARNQKSRKKTIIRRRKSLKWHLRLGFTSESIDNDGRRKIWRPCRRESLSDSEEEEGEEEEFEEEIMCRKPATIQLQFDAPENHPFGPLLPAKKSWKFEKSQTSVKAQMMTEDKVLKKFSRIDLEFEGPNEGERSVVIPKKCKKRSVKNFSSSPPGFVSSEPMLTGRSLLIKDINLYD